MSKVMGTSSLKRVLERTAGEYLAKDSIFEIPGRYFRPLFAEEAMTGSLGVMSGKASFPVGPAAGPHTQIAPNILAAYLAGARVFELKTVQENDRLDIEKPCIEALDEGHNVEWSTELSLDEARREYINGYLAVQTMAAVFSPKPKDFFFNASVGYTLKGIKGPKVDAFIEGLRRPELDPYWDQALAELKEAVESDAFARAFGEEGRERARVLASSPANRPVHSITLSTMHGCPPEEIGRIGSYLIEEKGFDAYIKLNPTLVGYEEARRILDTLGWERILLKRESFEHDLQFADALELIRSLDATAKAHGRNFGVKLSNTLANANSGGRLPGAERYMSGRALFPITARLAARLAASLPEYGRRFSYCGGVSAFNASELIKAGLGPLTLATDILKPGGYLRLGQIARLASAALPSSPHAPDAEALERLAEACLSRAEYREDWKSGAARIEGALPLTDCFAAPCERACPVGQKVPAYVAAQGSGESDRALAIILSDNALPRITGTLCDHVCQERCSRVDYEGPVRIRGVKLDAAISGKARLSPLVAAAPEPSQPSHAGLPGLGTAIVGAGPAGLACARHLAIMGQPVTVFDPEESPGGVPSHTIPRFRIDRELIEADIASIAGLGVKIRKGERPASAEELFSRGYTSIFLAAGAEKPRSLRLGREAEASGTAANQGAPEPEPECLDALAFLRRVNAEGSGAYAGRKKVVVAGGGNTACDAVRAAARIPGVEKVNLSY
ncbi:MAG TPA: FAD-dependent oxidoreductase, partial [Rectinemataceae bacterium]